MLINIIKGDITLSDCDAIVNAANERLQGGSGVCGAIFNAAGWNELQVECNKIGGCKTGHAVLTNGYNLKAKYVIHAVGPIYKNEESGELLAQAYYNSLKVANENHLTSIAFPSISTGIYGFPVEPAAKIAMKAIKDFMNDFKDTAIKRIDFNLFDDYTFEIFKQEYNKQF